MALRSRVPKRKALTAGHKKRNKNPKLSPFQREQKRNRLANQSPADTKSNPLRDFPASARGVMHYLAQQAEKEAADKAAKKAKKEGGAGDASQPNRAQRKNKFAKASEGNSGAAAAAAPRKASSSTKASSNVQSLNRELMGSVSKIDEVAIAKMQKKKLKKRLKKIAGRREKRLAEADTLEEDAKLFKSKAARKKAKAKDAPLDPVEAETRRLEELNAARARNDTERVRELELIAEKRALKEKRMQGMSLSAQQNAAAAERMADEEEEEEEEGEEDEEFVEEEDFQGDFNVDDDEEDLSDAEDILAEFDEEDGGDDEEQPVVEQVGSKRKRISFDDSVAKPAEDSEHQGLVGRRPKPTQKRDPTRIEGFEERVDLVKFGEVNAAPPVFDRVPSRTSFAMKGIEMLEGSGELGAAALMKQKKRLEDISKRQSSQSIAHHNRLRQLGLVPAATQSKPWQGEAPKPAQKKSSKEEMEALRTQVMSSYRSRRGNGFKHQFPSEEASA